jgi:hypothetical protein
MAEQLPRDPKVMGMSLVTETAPGIDKHFARDVTIQFSGSPTAHRKQ